MANYRDTIRGLLRPEPPALPEPKAAPLEPLPPYEIAREPNGNWRKGMSANPGGRSRSLKEARRWLAEETDNGRAMLRPIIEMALTGLMTRADGSRVQLTPQERKSTCQFVYEALHGKVIAVKGKVTHGGSVGVHGSLALDYDPKKLASLSQEDLDRLEALASVLMPDADAAIQDADIVDIEAALAEGDPSASGD